MQSRQRPEFAIFGGTFNPVHCGHVEIVRQLGLLPFVAQVLVIPAGTSPFKQGVPQLPADLRFRMVRESMGQLPKAAVLDIECRRPAPSYTVDTVLELRTLYPSAALWLAMGGDVFAGFHRWHHASQILAMAGVLVFPRQPEGDGIESAESPPPLPPPWDVRLTVNRSGHWMDAAGRCVIRPVPIEVLPVSGSRITRNHDLTLVPDPARPLLAEFWEQPASTPAR